ncbi:MAG: dUTP diphosphatase [Paludibacteraceae bacterium]|nr:dUTP diphosphatase [Paludibacteraceae bacterium]
MMQVRFKKLAENAVLPSYAHDTDAGLDLVATSVEYKAGRELYVVGFGIAVEIPKGYVGMLFPRSSISRTSLFLANSVGVIDSGYRGEIRAHFRHNGTDGSLYHVGDRAAQLIIMPYPSIEVVEADELTQTDRADGGFGSSGR